MSRVLKNIETQLCFRKELVLGSSAYISASKDFDFEDCSPQSNWEIFGDTKRKVTCFQELLQKKGWTDIEMSFHSYKQFLCNRLNLFFTKLQLHYQW